METNGRNRVYQRPPPASGEQSDRPAVCKHWRAGCCDRYPCQFLHTHLSFPAAQDPSTPKRAQSLVWRRNPGPNPNPNPNPNPISTGGNGVGPNPNGGKKSLVWKRNPDLNPISTGGNGTTGGQIPNGGDHSCTGGPNLNGGNQSLVWRRNANASTTGGNGSSIGPDGGKLCSHEEKTNTEKRSVGGGGGACTGKVVTPCKQFLSGSCPYGDMCHYLHKWFIGDDFSLLTALDGHPKIVIAIQLLSQFEKLYSASYDGTVKAWDCHSGQCTRTVDMGGEVECMLYKEPCFFFGMRDTVKAWNIETGAEVNLSGPTGMVSALATADDFLFAGTEDGRILVWRLSAATKSFEPASCLIGHRLAVVSFIVGGRTTLYSSSMDGTIKAWDLKTLQCVHTVSGHTSGVTSLLFWNQFLLSCSLDNTIKVWCKNSKEELELAYTHTEEHGVVGLHGTTDSQGKPILLCSLNDSTVRLYDLPSFEEKGRIFAKQAVRAMQTGPGGLLFTGDGTGELKVWRWSTN